MAYIRYATGGDRNGVKALLLAAGLPIADLDVAVIDFLVAEANGQLTGVVGVERYGQTGLLRSLAVAGKCRNTGMGTELLRAAEAHAQQSCTGELVLLTTTAVPFFARYGYAVIDRNSAPADVQRSAEFLSICPASATCMSKHLAPIP